MKKLRIYIDTSVIGGCLDMEFAVASKLLVRSVMNGEAVLLASDLTLNELSKAPEDVRKVLNSIPSKSVEYADTNEEAILLQRAYLDAGIVTPRFANDALHIAIATVLRVDVLVSWNYRHIVNFSKIRAFNSVNLREGYQPIEIRTPIEVFSHEN